MFRTKIESPSSQNSINRTDKLLFLGSCFSVEIGEWLRKKKLNVSVNPLGIVFNPYSLAKQLQIHDDRDQEAFFQKEGIWLSWDFHSSIWSETKMKLENKIRWAKRKVQNEIKECHTAFFTLGTAWVYVHKSRKQIVSNCHKVRQDQFDKKRLEPNEIVVALESTLRHVFSMNENIQIVLTVSPVRHIKDGLQENQLSKASLLLAIDQLTRNDPRITYFPAYEIMMDDLRDYRYYEKDLIHPSRIAVEYIRNCFTSIYLTAEVENQIQEITRLHKLLNHRVIHPTLEHISVHRKQCQKLLDSCKDKFSDLDWNPEQQLINAI